MDIEQTGDKDEASVNPNDYRHSRVESLSDGEEQPPDEHDSNTEDYDDEPAFTPGQTGYQRQSSITHGTLEYLKALSMSLDATIQYQTDKHGRVILIKAGHPNTNT